MQIFSSPSKLTKVCIANDNLGCDDHFGNTSCRLSLFDSLSLSSSVFKSSKVISFVTFSGFEPCTGRNESVGTLNVQSMSSIESFAFFLLVMSVNRFGIEPLLKVLSAESDSSSFDDNGVPSRLPFLFLTARFETSLLLMFSSIITKVASSATTSNVWLSNSVWSSVRFFNDSFSRLRFLVRTFGCDTEMLAIECDLLAPIFVGF